MRDKSTYLKWAAMGLVCLALLPFMLDLILWALDMMIALLKSLL
jgi:hypothetical protein